VSAIRKNSIIRRNDKCPCGSNKKFKACHSPDAPQNKKNYSAPVKAMSYIDTGESAVRYVICDRTGVKFFSDVDNKILVFPSRETATAVALMEEFDTQEPGEINVAGVGATKWEHLQSKLPFIEVESVEHAVELVRARIEKMQEQISGQERQEDKEENATASAEKETARAEETDG
jgi:uncharacterized protein YecA (UPF0149 family)